jgi:hypothetical protein
MFPIDAFRATLEKAVAIFQQHVFFIREAKVIGPLAAAPAPEIFHLVRFRAARMFSRPRPRIYGPPRRIFDWRPCIFVVGSAFRFDWRFGGIREADGPSRRIGKHALPVLTFKYNVV